MSTLKYRSIAITFSEVPDEVSLCINITNCPIKCKGCHSPELWEDTGKPLDLQHLTDMLDSNTGITCVCILGGDADTVEVDSVAESIREYYPKLKIAWYSGQRTLSKNINLLNFDYIKLGPYRKNMGPLTSRTTNQKFYKVKDGLLVDITYKFWK